MNMVGFRASGPLTLFFWALVVCIVRYSDAVRLEPCSYTCDPSQCPPITTCNVGVVRDRCDCCNVCGLEESQLCNLERDVPNLRTGNSNLQWHGRCGVDLECRMRTDVDASELGRQSICYCLKQGLVCGSDSHTYSPCQMAAEIEASNGSLRMVSSGPCKSEPKILTLSKSRELAKGKKATFICEVQGYPMPTVTWYFNSLGRPHDSLKLPGDSDTLSVSLRGGPQVTRITSHLQITDFNLQHEGEYQCMAENDLGMAVKTFSLVLGHSPSNKSQWNSDEI